MENKKPAQALELRNIISITWEMPYYVRRMYYGKGKNFRRRCAIMHICKYLTCFCCAGLMILTGCTADNGQAEASNTAANTANTNIATVQPASSNTLETHQHLLSLPPLIRAESRSIPLIRQRLRLRVLFRL